MGLLDKMYDDGKYAAKKRGKQNEANGKKTRRK